MENKIETTRVYNFMQESRIQLSPGHGLPFVGTSRAAAEGCEAEFVGMRAPRKEHIAVSLNRGTPT